MAAARRILLVAPKMHVGGVESYVASLARRLQARGHHVAVASAGGWLALQLENEGIPQYWAPVVGNIALNGPLLANAIRREGIELVHANATLGGLAAAPVCARLGVPWVMSAHTGVKPRYQRPILTCAQFLCVSQFIRRRTLETLEIDHGKLAVVYNGIDLRDFSPAAPMADLRPELGLRPDDFVVGLVARIGHRNEKGHHDLLQVLATHPGAARWRGLIVGTGKGLPRLRATARRLGIADRVVFAGRRTDMPAVYRAIDVLTLPSAYESMPLTVLEAMASAKPVVCYAVGGMVEQVEEGHTGYIVPYGDIAMLGERLKTLDDNRERAAAMGTQGRARAEQLFDLEQMVDALETIYDEVLAGHQRRVPAGV